MEKGITRRDFLKGTAAGAVSIAAMSLVGCGSTVTATPTTAPSEPPAGPSTFTSTVRGFHGDVTVTMTVESGAIQSVEAIGLLETKEMGTRALEQLPGIIVEANGVNVDAVSGATYTSRAILNAAATCMEEAGLTVVRPEYGEVSFTDGVYNASSKGHNGPVTVQCEFSGNKVISVEVTESSDTPSLIDAAKDSICPAIVEYQSLGVDCVSTATFSSRAILEAVADCAQQAGCDVTAFKYVPIPAVSAVDDTMDCDVCVIGGGTSGSVALYRLSTQGLKVVCLESGGAVGGAGEIAGFRAMMWAGAQCQREEYPDFDYDTFKAEQQANLIAVNSYFNDPRLFKHYVEDCGPMTDMLQEAGMELSPASETSITIPGQGLRWKVLHTSAAEMGATTLLNTRATGFLTNPDGSIAGVKAVKKDGGTLTVNCSAAIIATGGASASEEIMQKYFPNYTPYAENCGVSTTDGEGLTMAWDIGAEKGDFGVHAHNHTMPLLAKYVGIDTVSAKDSLSCLANVPLLWLNRMGRRFNNEATAYSPTPGGNSVFGGKRCYQILDQTTVDYMVENGTPVKPWRGAKDQPMPDLPNQLQTGIGVGYVKKGDTLETLADACGMDPAIVAEEVARYNTMVENGVDTDYGKTTDALVFTIKEGPFYAVEIRPRILGSFGGLVMGRDYEVLKEDGYPIPGLYASGDMSAGWFGRLYPNMGGLTSGHNPTSGYSAANSVIRYLGA